MMKLLGTLKLKKGKRSEPARGENQVEKKGTRRTRAVFLTVRVKTKA